MTKKLAYYNWRVKNYYNLVSIVAWRNVKLRYKNSYLGFLWSLLNPLMYLAIFVFVFGNMFTQDLENYKLYALSGLLFWNFFSSSCGQVINTLIHSAGILKSINVPPIIFPLSALMANLFNFLLSMIPFFGLMLWFGYVPGWELLLFIPVMISFVIFTFSFTLILSTLNVYFRDIEMFWTTILPAIFYATPVVYPTARLPEKFLFILNFNPVYHYILMFRDLLYYSKVPDASHVIISTGITIVIFSIALWLYQKLRRGFISNF